MRVEPGQAMSRGWRTTPKMGCYVAEQKPRGEQLQVAPLMLDVVTRY